MPSPGDDGPALDATLHHDRVARMRGKERWLATLGTLPCGAFFVLPHGDDTPWVQLDDGVAAWSHAGYTAWARWPASLEVDVLTPLATLAVLRAGYRPILLSSADLKAS